LRLGEGINERVFHVSFDTCTLSGSFSVTPEHTSPRLSLGSV